MRIFLNPYFMRRSKKPVNRSRIAMKMNGFATDSGF